MNFKIYTQTYLHAMHMHNGDEISVTCILFLVVICVFSPFYIYINSNYPICPISFTFHADVHLDVVYLHVIPLCVTLGGICHKCCPVICHNSGPCMCPPTAHRMCAYIYFNIYHLKLLLFVL